MEETKKALLEETKEAVLKKMMIVLDELRCTMPRQTAGLDALGCLIYDFIEMFNIIPKNKEDERTGRLLTLARSCDVLENDVIQFVTRNGGRDRLHVLLDRARDLVILADKEATKENNATITQAFIRARMRAEAAFENLLKMEEIIYEGNVGNAELAQMLNATKRIETLMEEVCLAFEENKKELSRVLTHIFQCFYSTMRDEKVRVIF